MGGGRYNLSKHFGEDKERQALKGFIVGSFVGEASRMPVS